MTGRAGAPVTPLAIEMSAEAAEQVWRSQVDAYRERSTVRGHWLRLERDATARVQALVDKALPELVENPLVLASVDGHDWSVMLSQEDGTLVATTLDIGDGRWAEIRVTATVTVEVLDGEPR